MEGYTQPVDGPELQEELLRLAEDGKVVRFLARARHLHPSDLSDVLVSLEEDTRVRLVQALPAEIVSEALAEMEEEEHPEEVLAALRPEEAADIVEELDVDDAADLISELPAHQAARILALPLPDHEQRLARGPGSLGVSRSGAAPAACRARRAPLRRRPKQLQLLPPSGTLARALREAGRVLPAAAAGTSGVRGCRAYYLVGKHPLHTAGSVG